MLRINLLAEEQAAEEMRRRDPVKRGIWAGGFLVLGMVVWIGFKQISIMQSNGLLIGAQAQWQRMEKQDLTIKTNLTRTGEIERKLAALRELSTNRFLWSAPLNALQFCLVENIQLTEISVKQSYTPTLPRLDTATKKVLSPATSTEKITMTLVAEDAAPAGEANHTRYMDILAKEPYFRTHLRQPKPIEFVDRTPGSADGETGTRKPATFKVDCLFRDEVRQ